MKLLFENWRKYLNEADTDGDGSLDPEELRKMAADLEGDGASEDDRDAVRMLLQYTYDVPAEQVASMVDKLEQLGGEAFRQAAEEGQITDEAQQAIGLEITPNPDRARPMPKMGPGRSSDQIRAQAKSMARKGGYRDPYAGGYDIEGISEGEDK